MGGELIGNRDQFHFMLRCIVLALGSQLLAYYSTQLIPVAEAHVLTTRLDEAIRVAPAWLTVYFLVFFDWIACGIAILSEQQTRAKRFTLAYVLSMFAAALIFIFYPCTMDRPAVMGSDPFSILLRLLYRIDSPTNLFPSLHVLISYLCWRGTIGCEKLPKWFSTLQFGILICVCLSILFVKQHVIADIPSAIVIGELALQASRLLIPESET